MHKLVTLVLLSLASACSGGAMSPPVIGAGDPVFYFSGYVELEFVDAPGGLPGKTVRFQRILGLSGKDYGWDNPGTRIAFTTDSSTVTARLYYSANHTSSSGRNGKGLYIIDGETRPEWTFDSSSTSILRSPEFVDVRLPVPGPGEHTYEFVFPYGDAVEFIGVDVEPDALVGEPETGQTIRYVAYGDSITQGFTASSVAWTYPYLLAEKMGWELINLGIAGRSSKPSDGKVIASLRPDVLTILMGCNDWQGGKGLDVYRANIEQTLADVRVACPDAVIYVITPLWVPERWQPKKAKFEIEAYRQVLRGIVADAEDRNLHLVEGPDLIDHEEENFDRVAVHPTDSGFMQMSDRLAERMADGNND